jgi:4-amino-4-deoxy-L-arabinose transferase-like glycosyltransferase
MSGLPWRWILPALGLKLALHYSVVERYGWHRDELYYRDAGLHPAAGYVDFPPVTGLLARLSHALFGDSLLMLRSFTILAGAAVIVAACVICRRLGGGDTAIGVTAFVLALAPFLLGPNSLFQTVSFDQLAWALVILATLEVIQRPSTPAWALLGAAVGLALMTKYTAVVLVVGLLGGMAVTTPARLRDRGLLLAAAVAAVICLPNLIWQIGHDWASVDFIVHPPPSATDESRGEFMFDLFLLGGPAVLGLAVAGAVRLWREPPLRGLAIAAAFVFVVFFASGGKSYYVAPALIALVPAGAVALERVAGARMRRLPSWAFAGAVVLTAAVYLAGALPFVLPVRSERALADSSLWDDRADYGDEIGWPELARQTERAYRAAGGTGALVTQNYGEAGAISLYGRGLPQPLSRHVSHRFWGPGRWASSRRAVLVGFEPGEVAQLCQSSRPLGTISNHLGIANPEAGERLVACRLRAPLGELWPRVPAA